MSFAVEQGAQALLAYISPRKALAWESHILSASANADRMVVQYSFYHDDDRAMPMTLNVIGKFYAGDSGARTYRVMRALAGSLTETTARTRLVMPRALFYDSANHFIAQERVEGIRYTDLIHQRNYRRYFRLVGEALAVLHNQSIWLDPPTYLRDHLADLVYPHLRRLAARMPTQRRLIWHILQAMGDQESAWAARFELAPIHRDVQLQKLFYGQGRVWLIDWDLCVKGDPALDIGHFIVHLQTQLGDHSKQATEAFQEGYFENRPLDLLERVPLYAALSYLRLACTRFRQQGIAWEAAVQDLLQRGARCVDEDGTGA